MLKRLLLVLIIGVMLGGLGPFPVFSAVDSCTATVSPTSMKPSTPYNLTFTVNNTSDTDILWVRVTRPSTAFTIDSSDGSGWGYDLLTASIAFHTLAEFHITPASSKDFVFQSTAGSSEISSQNWTVEVSGSSDGSDPVTCTGSLGVSIANSAPASDLSAPVISSVTVTSVTSSSVIVSFTTDKDANGTINYGSSTEYGSTQSVTGYTTSHSFSLSGLTASTTYHYQLISVDSAENTTTTDDATFATAAVAVATPTPTPTPTATPTVTTVPTTVTPTTSTDKVKPVVLLSFDFSKPYIEAPKISGMASDNVGVAKIDYSTDDGKNWLPIDKISALGKPETTYEFTPVLIDDGNYFIRARATDLGGNTALTERAELIIDRLPPLVGTSLFSLGPQVLIPDENGSILALANLKHKVTVSAVGGPTQINLESKGSKKVALTNNPDNGLWSGDILFGQPGVYSLTALSIDGARNQTQRRLSQVTVIKNGRVLGNNKGVKAAELTIYVLEPQTGDFVIWDGGAYSQNNPQKTASDGSYGYYLPAGKYYLLIKAKGFRTVKSNIFTIKQTMPLSTDLYLEKAKGISLGPFFLSFPTFKQTQIDVNTDLKISKSNKDKVNIVGRDLPNVQVFGDGVVNLSSTFLGKPTVVTLLNTWTPPTYSQIGGLEEISKNKEINVAALFTEESVSGISLYKKRGGYDLNILADPDGLTVERLNVTSTPVHIFVNRQGNIRKVKSGILNPEELMDNLIN